MSNSTDSNNTGIQLTTEILIKGIIGLTLSIFITCGTIINKNSKFEILLMKTTIVKTIITLGLTISTVIISNYIALVIIYLFAFAFYWIIHGVQIYHNDINDNDQKIIDDLNIKGNVLFTPDSTCDNDDNEKQPLLDNNKQLIINGINDAMSIISNQSGLSKLSKGIGNFIDKKNKNSKFRSISPSPISPLLQSFIPNSSNSDDLPLQSTPILDNSDKSPILSKQNHNSINNLSKGGFPTFDKRFLSTSSDNLFNNNKKRRNSTPKCISSTHISDDELNNNNNF